MIELEDVPARFRPAVSAALGAAGVGSGHLGVEAVSAERIRALNRQFRGVDRATDVLSFPVDGVDSPAGPRELGDVVLCPPECADEYEAVVHGVLHLCGYDHETDRGEMLDLQERILKRLGIRPRMTVADD